MKTQIVIALSLTLSALSGAAQAAPGGGDGTGNGGGGIYADGRYMTFYSAGLYTEPAPKTMSEVPGLDAVVTFVRSSMPFLSPDSQEILLNALRPSGQHEYYKAAAADFNAATTARLKAEFQRVTGATTDSIELYAVTDTEKRQTFLLPHFFDLKNPKDQAAILFHEAYWLLHPSSQDYKTVVAAESSFEALLNNPTDPEKILAFLKLTEKPVALFQYAILHDAQTEALAKIVRPGTHEISMTELLGDSITNAGKVNSHLIDFMSRVPDSIFLKVLQESIIPVDPEKPPVNLSFHIQLVQEWYEQNPWCGVEPIESSYFGLERLLTAIADPSCTGWTGDGGCTDWRYNDEDDNECAGMAFAGGLPATRDTSHSWIIKPSVRVKIPSGDKDLERDMLGWTITLDPSDFAWSDGFSFPLNDMKNGRAPTGSVVRFWPIGLR